MPYQNNPEFGGSTTSLQPGVNKLQKQTDSRSFTEMSPEMAELRRG